MPRQPAPLEDPLPRTITTAAPDRLTAVLTDILDTDWTLPTVSE
ncbi:hypothetical protein [Streptomyces sp. NPDC058294]